MCPILDNFFITWCLQYVFAKNTNVEFCFKIYSLNSYDKFRNCNEGICLRISAIVPQDEIKDLVKCRSLRLTSCVRIPAI